MTSTVNNATDTADRTRHTWRSLDELAQSETFRQAVEREFPVDASVWSDAANRRDFLKLMGASVALAGLHGCTQPEESIVPYVESPEHIVPGQPLHFASAVPLGGFATGVLVESHQGRPTKVEGNPEHPVNAGSTDIYAQASVLGLYDPDRSQVVLQNGEISNWEEFVGHLQPQIVTHRQQKGAGLRILTQSITSPTLLNQLQRLQESFPEARWHVYEPVGRDNSAAGARLAFGQAVEARYHLSEADLILSIDDDFLTGGPARLRLSREFADRRRTSPGDGPRDMNRLLVVESTPTLTGAAADNRLPLRPREVGQYLKALAVQLGVEGVGDSAPPIGVPEAWLSVVADELKRLAGRCVVMVGEAQPPEIHALAHAINSQLGNLGKTVTFTEPVARVPEDGGIAALVDDMRAGDVETLVILDGNPVFDAPAELDFAGALHEVSFTAHVGLYVDETAAGCEWHVPLTHPLEMWGDVRSEDGTATVIQPLIRPLYNNHSPCEILGVLLDEGAGSSYDAVRAYWREQRGADGFEEFWKRAVHDGVVPDTAFETVDVSLTGEWTDALGQSGEDSSGSVADRIDLIFRPDPSLFDGRFANNAWLQELPKPFTKLTWGNAALISPALSKQHGLQDGDVVQIALGDGSLEMPVWIVPGHPPQSVTLHYGNGRTRAGRVGNGVGVNVYPLRTSDARWSAHGASITPTGERRELPSAQNHFLMENRHLVRSGTLTEYEEHPEHPPFMHPPGHHDYEGDPPSFYPDREWEGNQWGMAIDLTACTGCNACVIACQSENNIPVVGPEEVARGREMHWIRVDTYFSAHSTTSFEGDVPDKLLENPEVYHQPVPCMHCEHAPCEVVCPVAATTHSDEGLNEMTYNRCVGTRYCSNNCPYKVRRFNFLDYTAETRELPVLHLLQNPDVTVRSRGVMEKCTYCVQRISAARIQSQLEGRPIADGEVVTACQSACPAQAITFGNVNDPDSRVSKLKAGALNYGLLEGEGTRPRTTYLAAVRNPLAALKFHEDSDPEEEH
ncbi:MAG: 4Fe-4S dicluster domain-containing protein [Planctomycetota bacterium]|nr:MAG: 4Fe-4S dicluster domain-containing protein [Planctomycetota bacterium]